MEDLDKDYWTSETIEEFFADSDNYPQKCRKVVLG
jgi:hypothetical protein